MNGFNIQRGGFFFLGGLTHGPGGVGVDSVLWRMDPSENQLLIVFVCLGVGMVGFNQIIDIESLGY